MTQRVRHLAVYDYGQGGVWLFLWAKSAREITDKYPELEVVAEQPSWMVGEVLLKIERNLTFDIDANPSGWLKSLVEGRNSAAQP